jgi:hypothetical protein
MENLQQLKQEALADMARWQKQNLAAILEIANLNGPVTRDVTVSKEEEQAGIACMARWLEQNQATLLGIAQNNANRANPFAGGSLTTELASSQLFDQALAAVNRWHEAYMQEIIALANSNPFGQSIGQPPSGGPAKEDFASPCRTILQRLSFQMEHVGMPAGQVKGWEEALAGCLAAHKITQTQYNDAIELIESGGVLAEPGR